MAFNWRKFPWTNLHDLNLDWIIQTVKTLEENLSDALAQVQTTVDAAITKLLTGGGDLTISKTGDVRISGNSVQLTGGTVVSDGAEQLTLHNPNSSTNMTANYNNGVLRLNNNQDMAAGVAVRPINTPADGGVDNSDYAANAGYVKDAVAAVDGKLDTEITNRTSGDAALQSTIDSVILPRLNKIPTKTSDLINDSGFGTYSKPAGGIPKADLAAAVQTLLDKADSALQTHQSLAAYRKAAEQDIIDDGKQDKLIAGEGITIAADGKTITSSCKVSSVNGQTGVVVLDASDVGAQRTLIAGSGITIVESENGDIIQSDASGSVGNGLVSFVDVAGGAPIASFTLNQTEDCEINVNDLNASLSTEVNNLRASLSNNYRTAAAQDAIDATKQGIITDLETIRSGAAKGATALQSVPATYRTAAEQDVIDDEKQDKLIAGEGITIAADGKTITSSGKVSSVNGQTGAVSIDAEDIIYTKVSQNLGTIIDSLESADTQMASAISELQTADASLDSRITAIETGDTPVTLYIYWGSLMGTGRVSLTKNGAAMPVTDFISKMQSGAKIIIGENNDTDSESSGFTNYRYKIADSTTASLAFDVANSFNGSNRTIIISGSSSTNGLMTGYQDIDHDDLSDYSPLPEGSTPASQAWVEDYVDTKLADGIIIPSSTVGSTKRFKLTVNDSGTISTTELT